MAKTASNKTEKETKKVTKVVEKKETKKVAKPAAKKTTKKTAKPATKKTTKKVAKPATKKVVKEEVKEVVTIDENKANEETIKLTNEAKFSVWVDVLILIFIVLMFAVILYGYLIAR